jgi:2-(1,2-epoxy-1,2-dihydrophenyl)acetyl-CoA isomerase
MNALTEACRLELLAALKDAAAEDVRVVVLTGVGRAFCVGQDLSAAAELEDAERTVRDTYNPLVTAIASLGKPVIAAINGPAVGAGMGLALACDLAVMADDAYLMCSFGRVALVPDTGVSRVLVRRLGYVRAFEIAATGRKISAAESAAIGLVNRVVTADLLLDEVHTLAHQLARGPKQALALTKANFVAALDEGPGQLLEREARAQGIAAASAEHAEGVAAFREKREPRFR